MAYLISNEFIACNQKRPWAPLLTFLCKLFVRQLVQTFILQPSVLLGASQQHHSSLLAVHRTWICSYTSFIILVLLNSLPWVLVYTVISGESDPGSLGANAVRLQIAITGILLPLSYKAKVASLQHKWHGQSVCVTHRRSGRGQTVQQQIRQGSWGRKQKAE